MYDIRIMQRMFAKVKSVLYGIISGDAILMTGSFKSKTKTEFLALLQAQVLFPSRMHLLLLLFFLCSPVVFAAKDEDEVTYLPHLIGDQPEFKHYAGYLDAGDGKKFFYWFVESERDPASDPMVLWLNGGPGCSSLTGFLVEQGPWRATPDGENLVWFEDRWNKIANIIFMESPQCVGFSYSEDGECQSGDDQTAADNHAALTDFFSHWPEYASNEFYVTGESYAGVYVPTLSVLLMNDPQFNFQGMAVGNGITDREIMTNAYTYYAWARGLFGSDLWDTLLDHCCEERNASNCNFYQSESIPCRLAANQVNNVLWNIGLNPYDYLAECYGGIPNKDGIIRDLGHQIEMMHPDAVSMPKHRYEDYMKNYLELSETRNISIKIPCSDTWDREGYLNKPEVREALHVPEFVQYWDACSNNVSRWYDRQYTDMAPFYHDVLDQNFPALIYNGDLDMACDHLGSMWFTEALDQPLVEGFKDWHYVDHMGYNQIAGFVLQYENLKFVSVKGAGHFVPTDKPGQTYIMWEKFLNHEDY